MKKGGGFNFSIFLKIGQREYSDEPNIGFEVIVEYRVNSLRRLLFILRQTPIEFSPVNRILEYQNSIEILPSPCLLNDSRETRNLELLSIFFLLKHMTPAFNACFT